MKIIEKRYLLLSLSGLDLRRQPITTMKTLTLGRTDTAAYTFVAVAGLHEIEKTITAPDQKTARREFWESLTEDQQDSTESVELVEVERF